MIPVYRCGRWEQQCSVGVICFLADLNEALISLGLVLLRLVVYINCCFSCSGVTFSLIRFILALLF